MKRPLVALIAILVIVASLVSIYLSQRPPTISINVKPFEGLGMVAAEEVGKLLPGGGQVVVVTLEQKLQTNAKAVEVFDQEITKNSAFTVTNEAIETTPENMMRLESGITVEQYLGVMEKHPDAAIIVSFAGAPFFPQGDLSQVPAKRPPFVAAGGFSRQMRGLLQAGIVQLAIVPRFRPVPEGEAEPKTPREWFDRFYTIVTPETANELPDF